MLIGIENVRVLPINIRDLIFKHNITVKTDSFYSIWTVDGGGGGDGVDLSEMKRYNVINEKSMNNQFTAKFLSKIQTTEY